jgi:hypothetical protein
MLLSALYHTPQHWLFTLRAAITGDEAKLASGGGQSSPSGIAVHPLSSVGKFPPYGFPFPRALLGATQFQLFQRERVLVFGLGTGIKIRF